MHLHVLHLQMHFVDTMHSEAYTLTYICTHSDAFDAVRILTHSYAYHSVPLLSLFCPTVRIMTHSDAFVVAGNRIQPRDDTVEEEGDGEESDEDLDGM